MFSERLHPLELALLYLIRVLCGLQQIPFRGAIDTILREFRREHHHCKNDYGTEMMINMLMQQAVDLSGMKSTHHVVATNKTSATKKI
jgi:hypothetical protein